MMKLLLGLLITFSVQASPRNLDLLRMNLEGCYVGQDTQGDAVSARVRYVPLSNEAYHQFKIDGKKVDYLDLRFFQNMSHTAIVTQMFEEGSFVDSRLLNNQISYGFSGNLVRVLHEENVSKLQNETLISIKQKGQNFIFEVYQGQNREFLLDFYSGYNKANFKTFEMSKVNCK